MAFCQIPQRGLRTFLRGDKYQAVAFGQIGFAQGSLKQGVGMLLLGSNGHQALRKGGIGRYAVIAEFKNKRECIKRMHITRAGGGTQMAQMVGVVFCFAGGGGNEMGEFVVFGGREHALLLLALQRGKTRGEFGIIGDKAVVDVLL